MTYLSFVLSCTEAIELTLNERVIENDKGFQVILKMINPNVRVSFFSCCKFCNSTIVSSLLSYTVIFPNALQSPKKKQHHNDLEQRRRKDLGKSFTRLQALVKDDHPSDKVGA